MRSDSSLRSTRAAEFHFHRWPNWPGNEVGSAAPRINSRSQRAVIWPGSRRQNFQFLSPDRSRCMSEQDLQNYKVTETGRTERTIATEEDGILIAAKRGDSAA